MLPAVEGSGAESRMESSPCRRRHEKPLCAAASARAQPNCTATDLPASPSSPSSCSWSDGPLRDCLRAHVAPHLSQTELVVLALVSKSLRRLVLEELPASTWGRIDAADLQTQLLAWRASRPGRRPEAAVAAGAPSTQPSPRQQARWAPGAPPLPPMRDALRLAHAISKHCGRHLREVRLVYGSRADVSNGGDDLLSGTLAHLAIGAAMGVVEGVDGLALAPPMGEEACMGVRSFGHARYWPEARAAVQALGPGLRTLHLACMAPFADMCSLIAEGRCTQLRTLSLNPCGLSIVYDPARRAGDLAALLAALFAIGPDLEELHVGHTSPRSRGGGGCKGQPACGVTCLQAGRT